MFHGFANVWTIVALGSDLGTAPMALRVAGERVVVFRTAQGAPAALIDRCPHRGVALSLGRVEAGELVCPFHGWRFDGSGRNCRVPWNPDAKLDQLGATALPVREKGGFIWLYTGFSPADEPVPSDTLDTPGLVVVSQSVVWSVHWTRVMENMLDTPHLPFVHGRTIGRRLARSVGERLDMDWRETDYGGRITSSIEGETRPSVLDYRFPNAMELLIDPRGRVLRLLAVCRPEDDTTTRLTIYTLRNFARWRVFDPVFRRLNARIAEEDRRIVESSDPLVVPSPASERSVRTDEPTLAFRRIWRSRLQNS